jgi:ACS family tartrate transporter-like MFS transporter
MAGAMHGHATLFIAVYLMWGFAIWAVSFGNIMCWPDLLPGHLLAVACAAINTVSQIGAFLMPYAWGAARDATGGFEAGLAGLTIAAALAVLVALAARTQTKQPRLELNPT